MRTTILGTIVLQVIVWYSLFSQDSLVGNQRLLTISNAWQVIATTNLTSENLNNKGGAHYPTFNKLTLEKNGAYTRLNKDGVLEQGRWFVNFRDNKLMLYKRLGEVEKYEIVRFPISEYSFFIIKERVVQKNEGDIHEIEYKLTRL